MRGRLRSLTYRVYQRALLPAARVLLDPLLRSDFGYRLLIALPIAAEDFLLFPLRERSHRLRLRSRGAGGYLQDTLVMYPENVSVGDRVTCGGRVFIDGSGGVTIGSDVMIAYGAIITTATHDPTAEVMNRVTRSSPVVFGNNIWVGAGAKILPGVELADGVVVAAGAVVTKSCLEPDVIIAGVPARRVRKRKPQAEPETEPALSAGGAPVGTGLGLEGERAAPGRERR